MPGYLVVVEIAAGGGSIVEGEMKFEREGSYYVKQVVGDNLQSLFILLD